MTGLPDAEKTCALLIGIEHFDDPGYQPLPSCRKSVAELARLMADPGGDMWRVPARRVSELSKDDGRVSLRNAQAALKQAVQSEDLDALLVCVSSHGRRYPNDPELYLAMTDSDNDLPGTHLRFEDIRNLLEHAARDRRIRHVLLIVDACYSDGAKVDPGLGAADATDIDHLAVPGVVVLTATKHQVKAWPRWHTPDRTAFLGALIDSIQAGVRSPRDILTAKNVFDEACRRLAVARRDERRIPEPNIFRSGPSDIPLCRNAGYVSPLDEATPAEADSALAFMSAEECFAALEDAHGSARDDRIPGILAGLCARGDVPESEIARLVALLETTRFSAYVPHAYGAAFARLPAAGIARLADALHHNDVAVDERFVASLHGHDHAGRVGAEVCWSLLEGNCEDCQAIGDLMTNLIIADAQLATEALAAWQ